MRHRGERPRPRVITVEDAEKAFLARLKESGPQLLSLGVPALDEALGGGVELGEMVVYGGLPSHGKSVNALQATRAMVEVGRGVVFVSHEMTPAQIAKRMISTRTRLDADQWRSCTDDFGRESAEFWGGAGKVFVVSQCADIGNIEREVGRLAAQHDLIVYVPADFDGEEWTEEMLRGLMTNPVYAIIPLGPGHLIEPEAWVRMCAKRIEEEGAEQVLVDILHLLTQYLTSDKPPFGIMRMEVD